MNNSPITQVLSIKEDTIKHGGVGVGTFKTTALFTNFEIFPPKLGLTEADKLEILKANTDDIPMPDVAAMKKAADAATLTAGAEAGANNASGKLLG